MSNEHLDGQDRYPDEIDSESLGLRRSNRPRVPSTLRQPPSAPGDESIEVARGITRRQLVLIIAVNAVISAMISLCVVLLMHGPKPPAPGGQEAPVVVPSEAPAMVATEVPVPEAEVQTREAGEVIAEAPPTSTTQEAAAEPSTTPEVVSHVVKPGDTISGLAFKYDVPEEHIIIANRLKNANLLQMGAELIIPVGGLPDLTATLTPKASATSTPIPFEPPSAELTATVERVAVESDVTTTPFPSREPSAGPIQIEIAEVIRPGVVESEGVFLINVGDQREDLQGWTLTDANRNEYTFPRIRLWQGGSLMVYSREGTDDPPSSFFWGKSKAIWSPGEVATLKDIEGNVVTTFTVNP